MRLVDQSLIADHDHLWIVAPYLEDILEHLAHLRQVRSIVLLHFEDSSALVEGQDHEV